VRRHISRVFLFFRARFFVQFSDFFLLHRLLLSLEQSFTRPLSSSSDSSLLPRVRSGMALFGADFHAPFLACLSPPGFLKNAASSLSPLVIGQLMPSALQPVSSRTLSDKELVRVSLYQSRWFRSLPPLVRVSSFIGSPPCRSVDPLGRRPLSFFVFLCPTSRNL